jgi:hypothetical protein
MYTPTYNIVYVHMNRLITLLVIRDGSSMLRCNVDFRNVECQIVDLIMSNPP